MLIDIAGLVLLLLIVAAIGLIYRKVRHTAYQVDRLADALNALRHKDLVHTYQQLQSLRILEQKLELPQPLPPTRGMAASPDFLNEIFDYALRHKPRRILECSSGVSTIVLARAVALNGMGHVCSLEHDEEFAQITRGNLAQYGLSAHATVLHAPLREQRVAGAMVQWYDLAKLEDGAFDMIVIDGPPEWVGAMARAPAGPVLIPRLAPGGAIFIDDANRQDERRMVAQWRSSFPKLQEKRLFCEKGGVVLVNA